MDAIEPIFEYFQQFHGDYLSGKSRTKYQRTETKITFLSTFFTTQKIMFAESVAWRYCWKKAKFPDILVQKLVSLIFKFE